MTTPLISIIIPTYNRCDMLRNALESLVRQETSGEFTYEVIAVDNASTDATKAVVEEIALASAVAVRYVHESQPGPAPARNAGVKSAGGQYLAFFDDDERADREWLLQLYRAAIENNTPIVGGAMHLDLPQEILARLNHFVRSTSLREIAYYPAVRRYGKDRLPGTNNALVARRVFEEIGAFNSAIVSGGSDSDFFLRARGAGMAMYYTPHAVVRHYIAPNRLSVDYFRWDAQQGCSAFALLDREHKGALRLAVLCVARLAHAALVVVPLLGWSYLRGDAAEILGQKVRLWRAEGYARRTLALLAPQWFSQSRYFDALNFRRGRGIGQTELQVEKSS